MKKNFLFAVYSLFTTVYSFSQGVWTQKTSLPAQGRESLVSFSVNGKGYLGTGFTGSPSPLNDFWEYNPTTDLWTQKADFPTGTYVGRFQASSFSIGGKGYVGPGSGWDTIPPLMGGVVVNDFWEYDPLLNIWTQKSSLPAVGRGYYVAFSINNKGYIGTGMLAVSGLPMDDFWEYNTGTDSWTQKANVPGAPRYQAVGFYIQGKGYVGTGVDSGGNALNDFYEYDTSLNNWTQKANFPTDRAGAVGFSIGTKGYIGLGAVTSGYLNDFYEYNSVTDTWSAITPFPSFVRMGPTAFSMNSKGYVSCGYRPIISPAELNDLWEYSPSPVVIEENNFISTLNIYPNPSNGKFFIGGIEKGAVEVYNTVGEKVFQSKIQSSRFNINLSSQPKGIYFVNVITEKNSYTQKIVIQ